MHNYHQFSVTTVEYYNTTVLAKVTKSARNSVFFLSRIWIKVKMQFYTAVTFFVALDMNLHVTEHFKDLKFYFLLFYFVFHVQNTVSSLFEPTRN